MAATTGAAAGTADVVGLLSDGLDQLRDRSTWRTRLTSSIFNGSAGMGFSSFGASSATAGAAAAAGVSSAGLVSPASLFSSLAAESFLPKFLIPLMKRVDSRRPALRAFGWV